MKRTLLACVAVALMVPGIASGKPPDLGYVLFAGSKCADVAATDLEVDASRSKRNRLVSWRLLTPDCNVPSSAPKVIVGIFRSGGKVYSDLLECQAIALRDRARVSCDLTCKPDAGVEAFSYSVCVGGQVFFDPELRLKGVRDSKFLVNLPACTTSRDKTTERDKCITATK